MTAPSPSHKASREVKNQHGLPRYIPSPIRRAVRQRCGFGCILCGNAVCDYEHIDPLWVDAHEHDPAKIALLCGSHHASVTRGRLSKQQVTEALATPFCRRAGFSFDHLDAGRSGLDVKLGSWTFSSPKVVLRVMGEDVLRIDGPEDPSGPIRISARFYDELDRLAVWVEDNELRFRDDNWDVELVGPRTTVRRALGEPVLELVLTPRTLLNIERLSMTFREALVEVGAGNVVFLSPQGRTVTSSAGSFGSCAVGVDIGWDGIKVGVGCQGGMALRGPGTIGDRPDLLQSMLGDATTASTRASILLKIAERHLCSNDASSALTTLAELERLWTGLDDLKRGLLKAKMGEAHYLAGRPLEALRLLDEASAIFAGLQEAGPLQLAKTAGVRASALAATGESRRALTVATEDSLRVFRTLHLDELATEATERIYRIHALLREWPRCLEILETDLLPSYRRRSLQAAECGGMSDAVKILESIGPTERVFVYIEGTQLPTLESMGLMAHQELILALRRFAQLKSQFGATGEAIRLLAERALPLASRSYAEAGVVADLATLLQRRANKGDIAMARDALATSIERMKQCGNQPACELLEKALAQVRSKDG